jgi:hypothetical protein
MSALDSNGGVYSPYKAEYGAAFTGDYGLVFLHMGTDLIELRAPACPEHQEEILEDQKADPCMPPWYYCDASCPVRPEIFPLSTGKRLKSFVARLRDSGLWISCWVRVFDGFNWVRDARYSGYRWQDVPEFDDETYQLAVADNLFPGVWPLWDGASQPVLREDGSVIVTPGYDRASGLWVQPPGSPGRYAIGPSLAHQLLAVAERYGRWFGSTSELAAEISWPRSARALTAALQAPALQRELVSLGVAAYREGWTSARVRGWVVTKKVISTPDTPELCR